MKKLLHFYTKLRKKILNYKYKKKVRGEKSKLYIKEKPQSTFQTKRNSFQFFKTKLEFDRQDKKFKYLHFYYLGIGAFLIVSTLYVMIFSHYFSIKTIDILRQDENINLELAYKSIDNFRYQPILLTHKEDLIRNLISHQPNIKEVIITKNIPNNLKILISSHENMYQFQFENKNYIITKNGTLIPKKDESSLPLLEIRGVDTFGIMEYKKYFDAEIITNIGKIQKKLTEKNSVVKIQTLLYFKKEKELHIIDEQENRIIFDLEKDVYSQIEKLNIFYKEYKKKISGTPVYIDLRINERIIYCSSESEYQCRLNLKSLYE